MARLAACLYCGLLAHLMPVELAPEDQRALSSLGECPNPANLCPDCAAYWGKRPRASTDWETLEKAIRSRRTAQDAAIGRAPTDSEPIGAERAANRTALSDWSAQWNAKAARLTASFIAARARLLATFGEPETVTVTSHDRDETFYFRDDSGSMFHINLKI
jgi:hypothetical protein